MSAEIKVLDAQERQGKNKSETKKIRTEGGVPAVIYGNNKPEAKISLDSKDLYSAYRKGGFFSKVLELNIGKEKIKALPQEIQFHPVKDNPLHADFLRVDDNSKVKVSIPISFVGREKSPGLKRGGILNAVRRTVDVYCKVKDIPDSFVVDVSGLKIRDNVKFSDLNVPEGVDPVIKGRDFTIAAIAGRVAKEETTTTDEATASEEGSEEGKEEN